LGFGGFPYTYDYAVEVRRGCYVAAALSLFPNGFPAASGTRIQWRAVLNLWLGYLVLYALAWVSKPLASAAAIWPANALCFVVYLLLPLRLWPLVSVAMICSELVSGAVLNSMTNRPQGALPIVLGFSFANILTAAGPAFLARRLRLFRREERLRLVISPLWGVALFGGVLLGALLGTATRAQASGTALAPAYMCLWALADVLSIVTFGPALYGILLGFSEPAGALARPWERWAVSAIVIGLFTWFTLVPWPAADQLVEPMLFAVPLVWLALRFSRRATSTAVAIVAAGVAFLAGHGLGRYQSLAGAGEWSNVVISIDIFLLIGCGGALLVNLLMLKQRALLEELAREHDQLRHYAQALDLAEDAARRVAAADLHDGVGQVLVGLSMTLSAMRVHATQPPLVALLEEAALASREAQEGLRVMIQNLSPPELEHASLDVTLQWLVDLFDKRFGFRVAYRITGSAELPRHQLYLVFRCIRELLINAYKHSQCQCAEVEVDVTPSSVELTVIDEGIGFDVRRTAPLLGLRFGLEQLRARVRAAGGILDIDSVPGEGSRVTVRLPSSSSAAVRLDLPPG
jgi:signal transduction histidine kinase